MELTVDLRQPVRTAAASLEPLPYWVLGAAVDDNDALMTPDRRQYSYMAECECPGDCLRDHQND